MERPREGIVEKRVEFTNSQRGLSLLQSSIAYLQTNSLRHPTDVAAVKTVQVLINDKTCTVIVKYI